MVGAGCRRPMGDRAGMPLARPGGMTGIAHVPAGESDDRRLLIDCVLEFGALLHQRDRRIGRVVRHVPGVSDSQRLQQRGMVDESLQLSFDLGPADADARDTPRDGDGVPRRVPGDRISRMNRAVHIDARGVLLLRTDRPPRIGQRYRAERRQREHETEDPDSPAEGSAREQYGFRHGFEYRTIESARRAAR